jgi:carbonic anhydrase
MLHAFRFAIIPCMALLLGACSKAEPQVAPEPAKKVAKKLSAKAKKAADAAKAAALAKIEAEREPEKFALPFAWESAKEEPLAQTRSFLRDAITDNGVYMEHGDKFFAEFADRQTPRATIVTCADSRVHNQAWDITPENDDFTIRDIGNQVENLEGSVEYGVEHLHTPLLMIVGHTGCGAVKAAMDDISKLDEPIRRELEHLQVPQATPGKDPNAAWSEAVVANVHNQVSFSLKRFSPQVHEGTLTVVGAVYDFRNDLGQGAGRLVIVNVNGNSDAERMASFVEAVNGKVKEGKEGKEAKRSKDGKDGKAGAEKKLKVAHAGNAAGEDVLAEIAKIGGVSARATSPEATRVAAHETPHAESHGAHGH